MKRICIATDERVGLLAAQTLGSETVLTGPFRHLIREEACTLIGRAPMDAPAHRITVNEAFELAPVGSWRGRPHVSHLIRVCLGPGPEPDWTLFATGRGVVGPATMLKWRHSAARQGIRAPVIGLVRDDQTLGITWRTRVPAIPLRAYERVSRWLFAQAMRRADVRIAVSEHVARNNQVEAAVIAPEIDWERLRTPWSEPVGHDLGTPLFIGRLELEKGCDTAIRAAAASTNCQRLEVIGDGSQRSTLEGLAQSLSDDVIVDFKGRVPHDETLGMIRRARMVLVPSRSEGFGLAAFEAAAMNTPVLASRTGGLPEACSWYKGARLLPAGDERGWADAIDSAFHDKRPDSRSETEFDDWLRQTLLTTGWHRIEDVVCAVRDGAWN